MFLSMLVAWMFPDVPLSLREQLKKENAVLMEFLLNHDQEACAKSRSSKRSIHCVPTNIEIVVEAPPEEQEDQHVEEEKEVGVEINLNEPRQTNNADPEVETLFKEVEEDREKQQGGDDMGEGIGEGEKEKDGEINEEDGVRDNEQEGGEAKEEGKQINEDKNEMKADEIDFSVDLDSFMSELGLLGERNKSNLSHYTGPAIS